MQVAAALNSAGIECVVIAAAGAAGGFACAQQLCMHGFPRNSPPMIMMAACKISFMTRAPSNLQPYASPSSSLQVLSNSDDLYLLLLARDHGYKSTLKKSPPSLSHASRMQNSYVGVPSAAHQHRERIIRPRCSSQLMRQPDAQVVGCASASLYPSRPG